MSAELEDIVNALKANEPFSMLTDVELNEIAENIEIRYTRKDECVQKLHSNNIALSFVRKGAVDILDPDGSLFMRVGEGHCFGFFSLLTGGTAAHNTYAIEDSLIYRIPQELFEKARKNHIAFAQFFSQEHESRLRTAISRNTMSRGTVELMTHTVDSLVHKEAITIASTASIIDAAKVMAHNNVSSVLVTFEDNQYGIVTDRDLRNKVVAVGKDLTDPVSDITTNQLVSADSNTIAFEALHILIRHNMHHLPIMNKAQPIGMITMTDIMRLQSANSVFLLNDIYSAKNSEEVAKVSKKLPEFIKTLIEADATAKHIGHAVTSISEAITNRLIDLAIEELGAPPAKFCWMAFGSQARNEQTAHSDQDNGIIVEDGALPQHDAYFKSLATRVSDGLNECGFVYCPGDVMATNEMWRQDLTTWQSYLDNWVQRPEPQALLYASIFFDMRPIYGEASLCHSLLTHVTEIVPKNSIFLSLMAANALRSSPPLGFFRHFVLEKSGEHKDRLDMKHNGIALIVDIARTYALSLGITAANTDARIRLSAIQGGFSDERESDLRDAFEFIGYVRLKHQGAQIKRGEPTDNYIDPNTLSAFDRHHLKDAFKIIHDAQRSMAHHFNAMN